MDELVSRFVKNVGLSEDEARRTVAIMISFLRDAGPSDRVDKLMEALPESNKVESPFDGSFAGATGAMSAFNALTTAGLDLGEVQGAIREFVAYAKENADDAVVAEALGSLPGLNQFV